MTGHRCGICRNPGHNKRSCEVLRHQQGTNHTLLNSGIQPGFLITTIGSVQHNINFHVTEICYTQNQEIYKVVATTTNSEEFTLYLVDNKWRQSGVDLDIATEITNIYIHPKLCYDHHDWTTTCDEDEFRNDGLFYWFNCYTGANYAQKGYPDYRALIS